ncbi:MAG: PIN domain-containing protein [Roseateles sp.]|uniref:PIN domain-containing protein n=1 Tax=Roseateles sp. TaxID=1971397 RepID=UPI0039EA8912
MPGIEVRDAGPVYTVPRAFVDTNVLIYTLDADPQRSLRAERLLAQRPFTSVQALNEVVNVLRRRQALDWAAIADVAAQLASLCEVVGQTLATHRQALLLMSRYPLSWWDALMLAAAVESGAETFFSEDLQDGLLVQGRLRVRNPFTA